MKIALCGNRRSGKTAFTEYLVRERGFVGVSYTTLIKMELATALALADTLFETEDLHDRADALLEQMLADKERYRDLIVAWADVRGWSGGAPLDKMLKDYADSWMGGWAHQNIVIDNVRFPEQADVCRKYGFLIVRLAGGAHVDIPSERSMDGYRVDMGLDIGKSKNVGADYYAALEHSYAHA